jgi:GNAT superfamily N-acetyltransferase
VTDEDRGSIERSWDIRPAEPADAPAIAAVAVTGWRDTYAGILDAGSIERFVAGAYSEASVRRRIAIADRFDVAVAGGAVVGFAEWALREAEAELVAIYLLPAWKRQGIGGALHERGVEAYRGRVGQLVVHLVRDNRDARSFYGAMGYRDERAGTWDLFGTPVPDLRLVLPLLALPTD